MYAKILLVLVALFPLIAVSGPIDFESIPGVDEPTEGLEINTQFLETHGISFRLEDGRSPRLAKVGSPITAFESRFGSDTPAPDQNVGLFFLTDDGVLFGLEAPVLIVEYQQPTAQASGVILDIDFDERFTIEARDASQRVLSTVTIQAGDRKTGDGLATPWSIALRSAKIHSIRFEGTRTQAGVFGLGFDNFSPVSDGGDCEFINPINPNRDVLNDSDDYYLREPSEVIDLYYRIPATLGDVIDARISVRSKRGRELYSIPLPLESGENQHVQWDRRDSRGRLREESEFKFVLKIKLDGSRCLGPNSVHVVSDLVYTYRPLIFLHRMEKTGGPLSVSSIFEHSDLMVDDCASEACDTTVKPAPLEFSDLVDNNGENFYLDVHDDWLKRIERKRRLPRNERVVYHSSNAETPNFIFVQYWMFLNSSEMPNGPEVDSNSHEGDWELFQVALKLDSEADDPSRAIQPFAATASQHHGGQTLWWQTVGNGPGRPVCRDSSDQDQDYFARKKTQPVIYLALGSHAVYFKRGLFQVPYPLDNSNDGHQYACFDTSDVAAFDATHPSSRGPYRYALTPLDENPIVGTWLGRWGTLGIGASDSGPRSPEFRGTGASEADEGFIYMLQCPATFHNRYIKGNQSEIFIENSESCAEL